MTTDPISTKTLAHPIRLRPDFNPHQLALVPPSRTGVLPWTWLADPNLPENDRDEYLAQHVRGTGTTDPIDRELRYQPRQRRSVVAGFLRQQVLFDCVGAPTARLRLTAARTRPGHPASETETPVFPFTGPVALIGTSVAVTQAKVTANQDLAAELADLLSGRGIESRPVVAVSPQREWIDTLLMVDYGDDVTVRFAASTHFQPYLTVWRPSPDRPADGRLDVVDLADPSDERVVASAAADLRQMLQRTCPMIPGAGCGDLCTMHGGPWVSSSIRAAGRWERRRERLIRALGCDTCGDGSIKIFMKQVWSGRRNTIPALPARFTETRFDRLAPAPEES